MSRCSCGATGVLMFMNCCRACFNQERREQRHANPLPELTRGREWQAKNWYGITLEAREQMAKAQNYCCIICKTPEDQSAFGLARLVVEHCKECTYVRGLACNTCNGRISRHERGQHVAPEFVSVLDEYINKNCWLKCRVRRDVGLRARKTRRSKQTGVVMTSATRR